MQAKCLEYMLLSELCMNIEIEYWQEKHRIKPE